MNLLLHSIRTRLPPTLSSHHVLGEQKAVVLVFVYRCSWTSNHSSQPGVSAMALNVPFPRPVFPESEASMIYHRRHVQKVMVPAGSS